MPEISFSLQEFTSSSIMCRKVLFLKQLIYSVCLLKCSDKRFESIEMLSHQKIGKKL